jgi:5-oxoprolinase (ATP-hydrolysing)
MSNAIKKISVQRGHDVSDYTLSCFGGAGAQHACLVADNLGMKQIHLHPYAGVLSAFGIGLADTRTINDMAIEAQLDQQLITTISLELETLKQKGVEDLLVQGLDTSTLIYHKRVYIRYLGSDTAIAVTFNDLEELIKEFESIHFDRFGFASPEKKLLVESIQVETVSKSTQTTLKQSSLGTKKSQNWLNGKL